MWMTKIVYRVTINKKFKAKDTTLYVILSRLCNYKKYEIDY